MKGRNTRVLCVIMAAVLLAAAVSTSRAVPPGEGGVALSDVQVAGTVASRITYQGRLTDGAGNPLSGNYNLDFQLFNAASGGSGASTRIAKAGLQVRDGLFTVELDVPAVNFSGGELWLQIWANGTALNPRQPLLPVPYALGLRPGAVIVSQGGTALEAANVAGGYALKASSNNNIGLLGIAGLAPVTYPTGIHGVHGTALSGVGVYGQGGHTGTYGSGSNHGVKGESSQGDGVLGSTSSSNANSAGVRARNTGAGAALVSEGDLVVTGAYRGNVGPNNGAPYPRPAYDSGWVNLVPAQEKVLTHNIGGNVDNYVVDLQFRHTSGTPSLGIHNLSYGGDLYGSRREGAYWKKLTSSTIAVERMYHDLQADQARVRIWVYR